MKYTTAFLLVFFAFLLTASVACHKSEDANDATDPVVSITSPASGASLSGAVTIAGVVTDNSLHELNIKITRDAEGPTLFEADPTVHDLTSYTIAETWTPVGITAATPVTLTVTAEDHNENVTVQTVRFTINP